MELTDMSETARTTSPLYVPVSTDGRYVTSNVFFYIEFFHSFFIFTLFLIITANQALISIARCILIPFWQKNVPVSLSLSCSGQCKHWSGCSRHLAKKCSPRTRHLFTQGLKSIRQVFTVFLTNFPPCLSLFLLDMMKISPGIWHHSFFWMTGIRHVEKIPLPRIRHQLDICLVMTPDHGVCLVVTPDQGVCLVVIPDHGDPWPGGLQGFNWPLHQYKPSPPPLDSCCTSIW
jgi:hypothetical protein